MKLKQIIILVILSVFMLSACSTSSYVSQKEDDDPYINPDKLRSEFKYDALKTLQYIFKQYEQFLIDYEEGLADKLDKYNYYDQLALETMNEFEDKYWDESNQDELRVILVMRGIVGRLLNYEFEDAIAGYKVLLKILEKS